ncbi:hypothetical protein J2X46_002685 [Nocardioides sp. BE266]|uniref:hypothetical protein n=1 Tax=Nocardioides sp. BE266 TaxID=2817725 RepID=UPI0028606152|nr:hypothetical protein [Nocardioides sp. BE266]MDR7253695.1 hypothetical protein [Nocardioides sp. BE266]
MPSDPYERIVVDGKVLDALTLGAIKRAEAILGRKIPIVQGSYNAGGVAASAGTHDFGGVFDTIAGGHDDAVKALRAVGFAAWYRPTLPGVWSAHCHAVLIGHGRLAPAAARQVQAYLARRDGLVSNAIDSDPGWTNTARYTVQAFHADVERGKLDAREAKKLGKVKTLWKQIKAIRKRRKFLAKR